MSKLCACVARVVNNRLGEGYGRGSESFDKNTRQTLPACTPVQSLSQTNHVILTTASPFDLLLTLALAFISSLVHHVHYASVMTLLVAFGNRLLSILVNMTLAMFASMRTSTSVTRVGDTTSTITIFGLGCGSDSIVVSAVMLVIDETDVTLDWCSCHQYDADQYGHHHHHGNVSASAADDVSY